jgi:hypothetical protein
MLKRLEQDANQQDSKWKEDARKVAILIDLCENLSCENQNLLNAVFFKAKLSLRIIKKFQTTDPVSKPELRSKWEDLEKKLNNMFEATKSSVTLCNDIKARYKLISPTDNPLS